MCNGSIITSVVVVKKTVKLAEHEFKTSKNEIETVSNRYGTRKKQRL